MTRIAFASEEDKGLDSEVSSRFGRAKYFVIVDVENGEVKQVRAVENPGGAQPSGAGIKAVQKLVDEKVQAAVAGAFGPNSLSALEELGIKHFELSGIPVRDALKKIQI